jgi:hypothetical protein
MPDTAAPTVPQDVTAIAQSPQQVLVSWRDATDAGSGIDGYDVFRDGAGPVATVANTVFTDLNLTPATTYRYTVRARDRAAPANMSAESAPAQAMTLGEPDSWTSPASLSVARVDHTATLLPDGRVLVVGGRNLEARALASAELYDLRSNRWTATGPMTSARSFHNATLLTDGRVLVTGGLDGAGQRLESVELFDPFTDRWSRGPPLLADMANHAATLLPDGRVVVVDLNSRNSVQVYDPGANGWMLLEPTSLGGGTAFLAALADGRILLLRASDFMTPTYAYVYSPSAPGWSRATEVLLGDRLAAAELQDGRVLVTGPYFPYRGARPRQSWIFDPARDSWDAATPPGRDRDGHTLSRLPNGKVLIAGGRDVFSTLVSDMEVFDPLTGAWSPVRGRQWVHERVRATAYPSGPVLFTGGRLPFGSDGSVQATAACMLYWP